MSDQHAFVIPAYGLSPFLSACLESLQRQTIPSRIVVTTSTPSDALGRIVEPHGVELKLNPDHLGIGADWNFALRSTGTPYVTLAHQDDVYRPEFLAESLAAMRRCDAAVCFTGYDQIDDGGVRTHSRISRVQHLIEAVTLGTAEAPSERRLRAFLAFGNPLPCSSVTFDLDKLPGFAFSDDYASNLDWDAWLRLLDAGQRFARSPRRLVGRRRNLQTATAALVRDGRRAAEDLRMFRRIWPRPLADLLAIAYRAGY